MDIEHCPICGSIAPLREISDDVYDCDCSTCGEYKITREAISCFEDESYKKSTAKISSYLRYRTINKMKTLCVFANKDEAQKHEFALSIDEIIEMFPENINERIDKALINLSKLSTFTGEFIKINTGIIDYSLFMCDSFEWNSISFILEQLYYENYIENETHENIASLPTKIRLTVKGWNRVFHLEKGLIYNSKKAFVAMWFDKSMEPIYENAIKKAIIDAHYEPQRVDKDEHNGKICDRIIADIRRCKFIICDFTGQRGGVYFEAGFAMGLGKPVIWTCRKDEVSKLHFDTRQYNHIVWENETDLYEALLRRIQATIV